MRLCPRSQPVQGPLVADDLLQLITVLYSLSGDLLPPHPPFYSEDERRLKEALTDALAAAAPHEVASLPEVQQTLRQVCGACCFSSSELKR